MRVTPKQLTTQAPQLDICCLPNWWVYRQGDAIVISCRGIVSRIDIISTAMHFGGRREWFKCPDCGGRARILYGPDFAYMGRISPAGHASGLTIHPPGNASAIGLSLGLFSCVGGSGVMGACWSLSHAGQKG